MSDTQRHDANVFLPGCLGPVRREVVLASDYDRGVQALESKLHATDVGRSYAIRMHAEMREERDALAAENARLRDALTDALQELREYELACSGEGYNNPKINAALSSGKEVG